MGDLLTALDIDLLMAAQKGDVSAFGEVYRRHARAILRYAWAKVGDQHAAEDLSQETFVVAWDKRKSATIVDESLLPWLLVICRNHVRNHLRKRIAQQTVDLPATLAATPGGQEDLVWMSIELNKLSPMDRRLCELCLIDGFSYREAAGMVESTEAAVRKRIQRARTRLRTATGRDE